MNPNNPYGQQMPMQQPQRRHENNYGQMAPHMRPHPAYQQYYHPSMAPMMPQYPQHYQQTWYPYSHHIPAHHAGRHQYYPQPSMAVAPHQMAQMHGPMMIGPQSQSQPQSNASVQHNSTPPAYAPQHLLKTSSTTSVPRVQTPPSRPVSTASVVDRANLPSATSVADIPDHVSNLSMEPAAPAEEFSPPLPWLSVPDQPFPSRALRKQRKVLRSTLGTEPIVFPLIPHNSLPEIELDPETSTSTALLDATPVSTPTHAATISSKTPSDDAHAQSTPSSTTPAAPTIKQTTPTQSKSTRAIVPVVPIVPVRAQGPAVGRIRRDSATSVTSKKDEHQYTPEETGTLPANNDILADTETPAVSIAAPPPPPSSWAALLRSKTASNTSTVGQGPLQAGSGLGVNKTESLGDVLHEIDVNENPSKFSFLQPRGLVNTGNMCYMNSVLQMLVFCTPFYEFLDRVAKRAPHTFKSDTPLIDAMILFMREFPTIDAAPSVEQLRLRLKPEDYERYGDSFIPEYVYNVIKQLPRFRDMRRGHQQDAQEFLGFLLEELHEECAHAMRSGAAATSGRSTPVGSVSNASDAVDSEGGWMEVGHKQKTAVTRSSGTIITESPVTNIFGGKLRSELKVSGNKLSVTLEPYQPLQLDIGSPQVNNIIDALKGLTRPESMQGDFQSVRGPKTSATKQVFIETLPPVLILHLKRFHYDSTTQRVEKIWKKIGYPLELDMPKEVFPTSLRNRFAAHGGLPKYRLIGVIYHHGKNASGGHYTVDIRRQDGREWVRVDDTLIRRVRSEDVAEGGSEEDPKVLAVALERHNQGKSLNGGRFEQIEVEDDKEGTDRVWSQVNGHQRSKSTLNTVANGSATPTQDSSGPQTPRERFSVKDNKVAYLLFYQRISI